MGRKRSDAERQIADLLQTAKKSLRLSVPRAPQPA
jgi:hypothetical protein